MVPRGSVTVEGFDVTWSGPGAIAVAVAVLTSRPASRSAWVSTCNPRHTTVEVGAGAGSMRVVGHVMPVTCGSITVRSVSVSSPVLVSVN